MQILCVHIKFWGGVAGLGRKSIVIALDKEFFLYSMGLSTIAWRLKRYGKHIFYGVGSMFHMIPGCQVAFYSESLE